MLAAERREKIAEGEARLDRLVVPHKMAVGAETTRDRRPGELKFHVIKPVGDVFSRILFVNDDGAAVNADLRERRRSAGIGLQRPGKRLDQSGPVRLAAGQERDGNGRSHQRHVGDFNPSREEREIAQMSGQFVGDYAWRAGAVVAEHDVVEGHRTGREQRDRDIAAYYRIKSGNGVDFFGDGISYRRGWNEK